jgi:nucleolar protein 53
MTTELTSLSLPEAPLEVVLPDELRDSLRLLKPEGNLLKDRFRNMMLQGKVEARRQIPYAKQKKYTVSEKWSYKDWKVPSK